MKTVVKRKIPSGWVDRLWYAVEHNDVSTIIKFIDQGIDVNHVFRLIRTEQGHKRRRQTPIYIAVRKNYKCLVDVLIKAKCNLNHEDDRGETPLFVAIQSGHFELVRLIVEGGCNIHHYNSSGETIVHAAVSRGSLEILQYLIDIHCNVDVFDHEGYTPLMLAAELHAKAMDRSVQTRWTHGQDQILQCLAKSSQNISAFNIYFETALHISVRQNGCFQGHFHIPLIMIQHGADVSFRNEVGESPVSLACASNINPIFFSASFLHLMVLAGAKLDQEAWLFDEPPTDCSLVMRENLDELREKARQVQPLQNLCRVFIRSHLGGKLWSKIDQLPIPRSLKDMLKFKDYIIDDVQKLV